MDIKFNFGAIRDTIVRLGSTEILREQKNDTIENFMEDVRSSHILKKQHLVYKNIELVKPFSKERLAERFLNQNLDIFRGLQWKDVLSENRHLRKKYLEDLTISSKGDDKLNECINTLIESTTTLNFQDVAKQQEAYDYVLSHLTREVISEEKNAETSDGPEILPNMWKYVTNLAVNNFKERYAHLTTEEREVLNVITSTESNKKNFLRSICEENLSVIEKLKVDASQGELELLESLTGKIQSILDNTAVSLDEGILNSIEIKKILAS